MRAEPVGWGLVGLGRHARDRIAPAILAAANARLVGVVGRDPARSEQFATSFQTRAYPSLAALLQEPAVEAIFLVTPNDLHAPHTVQVAAAGRHVLCEKPMAHTLAECDTMLAACRQAGTQFGIGFHLRAHPGHRQARELVASGRLGEVRFARTQWASSVRTVRPGWWGEPDRAGAGVLYGTGVHQIDLLRFVLRREVEAVSAWTDASAADPLDSRALALLRFEGGIEGFIASARGFGFPDNDLVVHGPDGRLRAIDTLSADYGGTLELTEAGGQQRWEFGAADSFRMYTNQIEQFGRAVRNEAGR